MDKIDTESPATPEELRLMEIDDRIDSYIKGEMTDKEESKFLFDCHHDKELKERAIATAYLVKALKTVMICDL